MPRAIHHPNTDDIDLATVLRALGDPVRLTIVRLLAEQGEQNCAALQSKLDMPVSTCSYHLRLLREAGVTRTRAAGTERWMSVRQEDLDARFPGLLDALGGGPGAAHVLPSGQAAVWRRSQRCLGPLGTPRSAAGVGSDPRRTRGSARGADQRGQDAGDCQSGDEQVEGEELAALGGCGARTVAEHQW